MLNLTDEFLFGVVCGPVRPISHIYTHLSMPRKPTVGNWPVLFFSLFFPGAHVTDDVSLFAMTTRKLTETHLMLCVLLG